MTESKAWDWSGIDRKDWETPSEAAVYLAWKWNREGVHSILDLGCGLGRHAVWFAQNGYTVTAADLSEKAVEETRKALAEQGLQASCCTADMLRLPFDAGSFDAVFGWKVISHQDTEGVRTTMNEITRVLKPGGKLFVTLCSKAHDAFRDPRFLHIDENTVLKTEGAETEVPHFFADKVLLRELFSDYELLSVRHVTGCELEEGYQEKSHYYVEAVRSASALAGAGAGNAHAAANSTGSTSGTGKPLPLSGVVNELNHHGQMFKAQISVADLSSWLVDIGVLKQGEKNILIPTSLGIASGLVLKSGRRNQVIYYDAAMQAFLLRHMEEILDHSRGFQAQLPDDLPGLQK